MDQSPRTVARARVLRRNETDAEKMLWGHLRDRRLAGLKFRRQVPIPPYVADFACLSHMLIVEVDGMTHSAAHQIRHDDERTAFLESKGYRVYRVGNHDVFTAVSDVLDGIMIHIRQQRSR